MSEGRRPVRARLACGAMSLAARASRAARLGAGSTIGGRVALAVDPHLLETLGAGRAVALVSGTNGKTTTTRLLTEALAGLGPVATASEGSNMPPGIVTALCRAPDAKVAVLEVDEAYLPAVARAVPPKVIVLLNLSRDQLDRVGEVRMTAERWREAMAATAATVVANADDPLVVYAAEAAAARVFVAMGTSWRSDAHHCPACDGHIAYADGGWSCACGFARPRPDAVVTEAALEIDGDSFALETPLPGEFNRANLATAAVAARSFGVGISDAIARAGDVAEVAGRYATFRAAGRDVRLLLAKNPAGWSSLIGIAAASGAHTIVAVNARVADGHDPSWLFDVPFERLAGRCVVATGDRRFDLAVRLRHAGVDHVVADPDPRAALRAVDGRVDVIANYTAFQDLYSALRRPGHAASHRAAPTPTTPSPPTTRTTESAIRVVLVYPDLLGTYGDSGNALVLANRARWRGIGSELVVADAASPLPSGGDVYVIGGGEDGPQVEAARALDAARFADVVASGAVVFAVCAGYQILGRSFPGASGDDHEGVGLLDVHTVRSNERRAVGELLGEPAPPWTDRLAPLTGFENHASRTVLGTGVRPLMAVRRGVGNGPGRTDGAVAGRVVGTYLHGPALARNPQLADLLLELVTGAVLEPLDDTEEQALRAERFAALGLRGAALR